MESSLNPDPGARRGLLERTEVRSLSCAWCARPATGKAIELEDRQTNPSCARAGAGSTSGPG